MTIRILVFLLCLNFIGLAQEKTVVDNDQQFIEFLENNLNNGVVSPESTKAFYKSTWSYWMENKEDYNNNPEKYSKALSLFHKNQQKYIWNKDIKLDRYEEVIEDFCRFDSRNTLAKNPILFIGSSSIVYWETSKYFPEYPIINRGFGGASIPEIIYYYDDIIKRHSPSVVIVYCDIDVENGKSPIEAVNAFSELIIKIEADFPKSEIIILSMKPTLIDDFLGKDVRKNKAITNNKLNAFCAKKKNLHFVDITNVMIKADGGLRTDIFLLDGMHLNELGYQLWSPLVRKELVNLNKK